MPDRVEVAAVHDDEVVAFLDRLVVTEQYRAGSLVCSVCELPLVKEGLGAVREGGDGSLVFACAKLTCLEDFQRAEPVQADEEVSHIGV